jgi:hypothetical protein
MIKFLSIVWLVILAGTSQAQTLIPEDTLRQQVLRLQQDMDRVKVNLGQAQAKFQRGIAFATIGYSVTIAGGLMLGREQ